MVFEKCKIVLLIFIIECLLSFNSFAGYFDDTDWVDEYYGRGVEPDYADGDLEDKLGDSGYYYDLFPEERDGEPDDYDGNSSGGSSGYSNGGAGNHNFEMTEDFINNMRNLDTRVFKYEFPDGSTLGLTKTQYEKMKNQFFAGAFEKNGNIYYRYYNGDLRTGWIEEDNNWFYFDKATGAMVKNQLVEYKGKVYYLNSLGFMATNTEVILNGVTIRIDDKGVCKVVQ